MRKLVETYLQYRSGRRHCQKRFAALFVPQSHGPDAAAYAPVTVLVDERADGVHLSYDRMASLLAPYGNRDALSIARDLDAKVEELLRQAAA